METRLNIQAIGGQFRGRNVITKYKKYNFACFSICIRAFTLPLSKGGGGGVEPTPKAFLRYLLGKVFETSNFA